MPEDVFARIDSDGDGLLTQEEMTTAMEDRQAMSEGLGSSQSMNRMGRMQNAVPSEFAAKIMARKDSDGDGALSLEEMSGGKRSMPEDVFARIDSDGDGLLTQEEMTTAMEDRQAMLKEMESPLPGGGLSELSGSTDLSSLVLEAFTQAQGNATYQEGSLISSLFDGSQSLLGSLDAIGQLSISDKFPRGQQSTRIPAAP
jgi:Ca2+-binding EF-hand superfamily protein